jgi:hypothetical protein
VVAVRLADDRRGRVPFALVGVLLLVGSATVAAVRQPERTTEAEEPAVDRALAAAAASMQTALRRAVRSAGRDAARDPLVVAANTTYGRVLDDPNATVRFERALRARVYLAARRYLGRVSATAGETTATVRLPGVTNASDLRAALDRTRVARAGPDGTGLEARLRGVRIVATRDGRVVGSRRLSPSVVVSTPVLALHDRMRTFERRMDAGPLHPGLGRQLTARLYAMAWARGYAQRGGAPILNVLANRHVEIAANAAALAVQRSVLGRADPGGERAHRWASLRTGATDLALGLGAEQAWIDAVFEAATGPEQFPRAVDGPSEPAVGPGDERTFDAERAADEALAAMTDGGVERAINRTYRVRAHVIRRLGYTRRTREGRRRLPGNWTLVAIEETERTRVEDAAIAPKRVPEGWHAFARYERRIVRERTVVRTWRRGDEERTTVRTVRERTPVALAVVGRHSPNTSVPRRGVPGAYEPGGALDGPNLAGVPGRTVERLVAGRGGPGRLARRIVSREYRGGIVTLDGRRPPELRRYALEGVVALDRRIRNLSVTAERGAVGTFAANPARRLVRKLRERRAALLDAPATYDGAAAKARTVARAAYLDLVLAALREQARAFEKRRSGFTGALERAGVSLNRLRGAMGAAGAAPPERRTPATGLGGPLRARVDTVPAYLTLASVARERLDARGRGTTHPLVASNVNVFTLPYGDAVDGVLSELFGPGTVRLRTAAQALRASAPAARRNATVAARRGDLREAVGSSVDHVRGTVRRALIERGIGETAARRAVAAGLSRWNDTAARALALANGSAADPIARAAPGRRPELAAAVDVAIDRALAEEAARVPESSVRDTADGARNVLHSVVAGRAAETGQRLRDALQKRIGWGAAFMAGLPVLPPVHPWYVTVNVWHVQVGGTYERVTLRSRRGPQPTPYSRDRSAVRLDVDGDGDAERLGRTTRIAFDVTTPVVVVVPPGPPGVGDVDGQAVERSPGWPRPG